VEAMGAPPVATPETSGCSAISCLALTVIAYSPVLKKILFKKGDTDLCI
jgi:hypothetical protein